MRVEIVAQPMAGYTMPAYSWTCPLCSNDKLGENLSKSWVQLRAQVHLTGHHKVELDKIEMVVVPLLEKGKT